MGFDIGGAINGLGNYAGGYAKGYKEADEMELGHQKMALLQQANQREGQLHDQKMKDFARADELRAGIADIVKKYAPDLQEGAGAAAGPAAALPVPGAMQQPVAAPMPSGEPAALPVTGNPAVAAAPAAPVGAPRALPTPQAGGLDMLSSNKQGAVYRMNEEIAQLMLTKGHIDPKAYLDLQKMGREMQKAGRADAFDALVAGDSKPIAAMMAKDGLYNPRLQQKADPKTGVLQQMFVAEDKDGNIAFERPAMVIAMALGAAHTSKALEDGDQLSRKAALDESNINKNNAYAEFLKNGKGKAQDAGVDVLMIQSLVDKSPKFYRPESGKIGLEGKPVKDSWAHDAIFDLATDLAQKEGLDELTAFKKASAVVEKITDIAGSQGVDYRKQAQMSKDAMGYDQVRSALLQQVRNRRPSDGAAPAAPAAPAAQPQQPKAIQTSAKPSAGPAAIPDVPVSRPAIDTTQRDRAIERMNTLSGTSTKRREGAQATQQAEASKEFDAKLQQFKTAKDRATRFALSAWFDDHDSYLSNAQRKQLRDVRTAASM